MRACAFEASGRRAREDERGIERVFGHAVGLPQPVTSVISSASMFRRYPILIAGAVLLVIFMADVAYLEWSDARDPAKSLIQQDAGK